jgi:Malectin domain
MKKSWLVLLILLSAEVGTAMAGSCPPQPPTSPGNGQVAGIPVAGGTQYYFTDALLAGFDCFQQLSNWFPSIIQSTNSVNPKHQVVDMAYAHEGSATFFNVVVPTSGPYNLSIRYAFQTGLFPGVQNRPEGLAVNGVVITNDLNFPVTGNFETYETSSIVVPLQAGTNTIQLFNVDSASVSRVDTLTITAPAANACLTVPDAPTGASAVATSPTQVSLNWAAGTAPANCNIGSYSVFRSTTPGFETSGANQIANGLTGPTFIDKHALCNLTYYYSIGAVDEAGSSVSSAPVAVTTQACPASSTVQINSGGPAVSSFVADEDFTGGATSSTFDNIDMSGVSNTVPMEVFQSARTGTFSYTVPGFTPGSTHTLQLYFAETQFDAPNSRTFNVSINGTAVLTNFDVFAAAGDKDAALTKQFSEAADANGQYVISFTPVTGDAVLSGLQIK